MLVGYITTSFSGPISITWITISHLGVPITPLC